MTKTGILLTGAFAAFTFTAGSAFAENRQYPPGPMVQLYSASAADSSGLNGPSFQGDREMSGHLLQLAQHSMDSSPMVVAPGGSVPQTGGQRGVSTPNSLPGASTPSRGVPPAADVMVVAPTEDELMPRNSSEQGVETHNSMPMPKSSSAPR